MIYRYSTLADADECLRKYYEKHIAKSVPETQGFDTEFGTAMHLALKEHYSQGHALTTFRLYWNTLKGKQIKPSRYSWEELLKLGERFIERFEKKYSSQFKPLHIEKQIVMPIAGEPYQGTLDLLCEYEGKVTLVDYKTSAYPYAISKIYTSSQLYGYAALVEKELGVTVEQIMYFVFVKSTGNIQTSIKIGLDRDKLKDMLGNIELKVRDLATRTLWPRNDGCKFCVCGQYRGERD